MRFGKKSKAFFCLLRAKCLSAAVPFFILILQNSLNNREKGISVKRGVGNF